MASGAALFLLGELEAVGFRPKKEAIVPSITPSTEEIRYSRLREEMVSGQIETRGVSDERVLSAMRKVPRHEFVPLKKRPYAYGDFPLPIGKGQTISQPYIVALMTELAGLRGDEKVLEIGTGSGYQAAVLAEIVKKVFTIEIIQELAESAAERLKRLGYENVTVRTGDGYKGWEEEAPFDVILVTAAPEKVPPLLLEQLAPGGRLVIPEGPAGKQVLKRYIKKDGEILEEDVIPVRFVPLIRSTTAQID